MGLVSRQANTIQTRWRFSVSDQHPSGSRQARTDSCLDPSSNRTGCAHQSGVRARLIIGRTDGVRVLDVLWVVGFLFRESSNHSPPFRLSSIALLEVASPTKKQKRKRIPEPRHRLLPAPTSLISSCEVSLRWNAFYHIQRYCFIIPT